MNNDFKGLRKAIFAILVTLMGTFSFSALAGSKDGGGGFFDELAARVALVRGGRQI